MNAKQIWTILNEVFDVAYVNHNTFKLTKKLIILEIKLL